MNRVPRIGGTLLGAILALCGCHSPSNEQRQADVRLTITTPDGHVYNFTSDRRKISSVGERFHDIALAEDKMTGLLSIVLEKHHFEWQEMTAQTPYPKTQTALLLYSGTAALQSFMCTIGEPKEAVPILEEIVSYLPESSGRESLRETIRKISK